MPSVPFCGQTYSDRSLAANAQRCINLYPMHSPTAEDPNRIILYPTPGYSLLQDLTTLGIVGTGAIRGFYEINGILYIVSGTQFIKGTFSGTYSFTTLGTLSTSSGRCTITSNTVELIISDGTGGYVYNLGTTAFTAISGGSFPATGGVTNFTYQDGYVLAGVNSSKQVIQSNLLAGGVYGAQAFVNVTSFADNLVAVFSDQLQFYIFGPKVTEVRFDSGAIPFAFEKVQGVLIQAGCISVHTIVKVGSTIIWLASDIAGKAYVAALDGYTTKPLSTAPINEAIERYATVSDAFAYSYREADNQFYCLTFPSAGVTWAYDLGTHMWHERSDTGGRDLPDQCILWLGQHLVGDSTGKLWWMSQNYSTNSQGNGLKRVRTASHVSAGGNAIFLQELQVDIESGLGTLSGQGSAPVATLEISRDSGHTWADVGTADMGALGNYRNRLVWRRLGMARPRMTFRLTITDPVKTYILGAWARAVAGTK